MKEDVLQRITKVYTYYNLSKSAFSKKINMEQTTVNNQLIGKRGLSIDLIMNTLSSFDEISSEWLLRGKGDMFINNINKEEDTESSIIIERQKEEIYMLKGENRLLREQLGLGERKDVNNVSSTNYKSL